jgi:glutamate carboxypeptidase
MTDLVAQLQAHSDQMLADLEGLVSVESPSDDLAANAACATHAAELAGRLLDARPERCTSGGRVHLRWVFGHPRVLVLGHLDTVWPNGTLARWPFAVADGRATGPGAFDMKAGVVQGFHALRALDSLDGICVLLTTDEEIGSPTSRELIEETARGLNATLVLEPSAAGALKTERKGVSNYLVEITGRASHAGLEPEKGVNALIELAHQVLAIEGLARPDIGTTVTPTVATAGTASNVVPARASVALDIRAGTVEEQQRVDAALRSLQPVLAQAGLRIEGGINRPALAESASRELYQKAQMVAARIGLPPLTSRSVGGASDGNFTAGLGVPTLDGLGAVGDGAHAEGEWVDVRAMPERAALVAGLIADLLGGH